MSDGLIAYIGTVFDGFTRRHDAALVVDGDKIVEIVKPANLPPGCRVIELKDGLIAPGLVDLQVNGGGGRMLNSSPDVETIRVICEAHCNFGTTSLLPTLITDTPEITRTAVAAVRDALAENVPGVIGIHLEGPHLSVSQMGAHDPALIRVMTNDDCSLLEQLADDLPCLLLTVAPEATTGDQIRRLNRAGAIVSLGHTDASYAAAIEAAKNGAKCVTHLFNAMSQLGKREPGVVGAALESPTLFAGLIADGFHVDRTTINIALRAKRGPGKVFLVSDAMATAGSEINEFTLNGRRIIRCQGRLVLSDGRLAGADLNMISAVRNVVNNNGIEQDEALRMGALYPAELLGRTSDIGCLVPGARADFILLDDEFRLNQVWRGGLLLK
ncbi:N-acetylglucosamine-6-phosphate deacetylase [Rhodobacteraceae bacterium R_SAG10]|jgi:N-acetylglucosamine-6-phosphate deacetylase|nr:N-acetylglucosamine-6-phosphate deacetylase [Rhodobacteraceae bacterium R_SAG10]